MEDLLCPDCRDKVRRRLVQKGEVNRKQVAYSHAVEVKHKADQLLKKFKKFPSLVHDCINSEQYIAMLDKLYNYNQSEKVSLLYN